MKEILTLSGTELARRIRNREISSLDAVDAHVEQIRRVNPVLNAVVCDRFVHARAEARRADEILAAGALDEPPLFFGVPCTVKESFALEGMPQTAGLVARRSYRATSDATVVERMRSAGAIPLGVTNISELCMWMESDNRVYGRTSNPYDPRRIVGGSSGGEAAIIAAGGSPFGVGSDVGGSIRMPAFFCGVFGHKPSGGLVPNTGQFPVARGSALRMLTTGPICRRAEDLMPLLRLMAGPDGHDSECRPAEIGDPDRVDLAGLRVLSVPTNGRIEPSADLSEAQRRAADALAGLGALVKQARFEALGNSFMIWGANLALREKRSYRELLGQGKPINRLEHLLRLLVGRTPHTLPSLGLAILEDVTRVAPGAVRRALVQGERLREEITAALGADGVMLYPSYPRPAPRHNQPLAQPFFWVYTAIFNALEFPVTQVPLGLNAGGLPLGVQVAARHGNDHLTIAVARALERELGGWVPPY